MITTDLQILNQRFVDEWDSDAITTIYQNDLVTEPDDNTEFVRFSVIPGAAAHYLGGTSNGMLRQLGRVWLQIFVPHQRGAGGAMGYADDFIAIFRNWRSADGTVSCHDSNISIDPTGSHYQVTVSIQYESLRHH